MNAKPVQTAFKAQRFDTSIQCLYRGGSVISTVSLDVIPRVYEKCCNIRSPIRKTLDWGVETLARVNAIIRSSFVFI